MFFQPRVKKASWRVEKTLGLKKYVGGLDKYPARLVLPVHRCTAPQQQSDHVLSSAHRDETRSVVHPSQDRGLTPPCHRDIHRIHQFHQSASGVPLEDSIPICWSGTMHVNACHTQLTKVPAGQTDWRGGACGARTWKPAAAASIKGVAWFRFPASTSRCIANKCWKCRVPTKPRLWRLWLKRMGAQTSRKVLLSCHWSVGWYPFFWATPEWL